MPENSNLRKAQRNYRLFIFFNVISFSLLTGSILFLYAIRLGAGTRLLGFLSSLGSVTFIFSMLGRQIVSRLGVVKTKGYFWLIRYLVMLPVLLTLVPRIRDSRILALALITCGFFFFNFFKGIALAADKPILGSITRDADRARFVAGNEMTTYGVAIVISLVSAVLLGKESPLWKYVVFLACGIAAGVAASRAVLRLPEPENDGRNGHAPNLKKIRSITRGSGFGRLLLLVTSSNLGLSMADGFIILYFKDIYAQPDNLVVFFSAAGSIGVFAIALFSRFITDRVGSKPVNFSLNLFRIVSTLPLIAAPRILSPGVRIAFLAVCFFLHRLTMMGIQTTSDLYFFATTKPEDRLDLGIIFNIVRGLFGMIGALAGGFLLGFLQDILHTAGPVVPFRIFYSISLVFFLFNMLVLRRLPDVSDFSVTDLLSIIFSPRDLKAIHYLNRLSRISSSEEERGIVAAMASNRSLISGKELRNRLDSPSFFIRMEALNALGRHGPDPETESLLISHVRSYPYTTAHVAAELLGKFNSSNAVEALREALGSRDYLLRSKAACSLAEIGDRESVPRFLEMLSGSDNPRIIIFTARALEILKAGEGIPALLAKLTLKGYPHLEDDIILSTAGILGIGEWFYPRYLEFLRNPQEAVRLLRTDLPEPYIEPFGSLAETFFDDGTLFTKTAVSLARKKRFAHMSHFRYLTDFLNRTDRQLSPPLRYLVLAYLYRSMRKHGTLETKPVR